MTSSLEFRVPLCSGLQVYITRRDVSGWGHKASESASLTPATAKITLSSGKRHLALSRADCFRMLWNETIHHSLHEFYASKNVCSVLGINFHIFYILYFYHWSVDSVQNTLTTHSHDRQVFCRSQPITTTDTTVRCVRSGMSASANSRVTVYSYAQHLPRVLKKTAESASSKQTLEPYVISRLMSTAPETE